MYSLFKKSFRQPIYKKVTEETEKLSVYYHDLFDYPLTFADLIKWNLSKGLSAKVKKMQIVCQNGYYFLHGKEGLIYKRILRSRCSSKKLEIAQRASKTLSLIPSVLMVAVTGSLAMKNALDESDIDLMVITKKGSLWTSRLLAYISLLIFNFSLRRPNDNYQKDKLCLNMWMDESDLVWRRPRNIYTAHEIAQILPLVNKSMTYESFLYKNRWIQKFWPNAVKSVNYKRTASPGSKIVYSRMAPSLFERIAFKIQLSYMKSKITRETVTPTRAFFHPQDWGSVIISRLKNNGIFQT